MPDYEDSYGTKNEKLLKEIRDRFDYCTDMWKDIREAAKVDMQYVSGNPWPEAEVLKRKAKGRPCLTFDEISQYTNQLVNEIRQNKRAVNVVPRGYGANDKTAELRGDLIREIEYKSNAQSAYSCAFENICHRSYGGWKIVRQYVSDKGFEQELRIVRIPNPDSSYPDPDCKEADYSDAMYWFLLDLVPRKEYKRKYPKATITDFNDDQKQAASNWIKEDQIQVAEYWRIELKKRNLLQVKGPDGQPLAMFEDELPDNADVEEMRESKQILNEREVQVRKVVQYITNGLEILEINEEPGKYIPIVWLTGKELYVDDGGGPKRMLMSLVRLARDPQMLVNYYRTCQAEVVGMTPKTPWIGYTGQFNKPEIWQEANSDPKAFLEANPTVPGAPEQLLPLPMRQPYSPELQALELGAESARRGVQASMGLSGLPTTAQKINGKSGKALEELNENEDKGSFHFIDNFDGGIEHSGRILLDKIPFVYDSAREIGVREKDDTHRSVKINQPTKDDKGQDVHYDMTAGEHEVTISTGPSFQSERDAANDFIDTIVPELESLPLDPVTKNKFLAMLIRSKNIGPMGEKMAELLDPPDQTQQQLAAAQAQAQQSQQMLAEQQTEIQNLQLEKKAKIIDNQFMMQKAEMDNKLKLDIAEIQTKSQDANARAALTQDLLKELHVAAHEAATQAVQHAHEKHLATHQAANEQLKQGADHAHKTNLADKQAQNAADSQQSQQEHESELAQQSSDTGSSANGE